MLTTSDQARGLSHGTHDLVSTHGAASGSVPAARSTTTTPAIALIVADEPQISATIDFALETRGFAAQVVPNGATALDLLRSRPFDLVVLDLMMPVISGLALCRQIRETSEVPIMILTPLEQYDEIVAGSGAGAYDHVTKPFHPREVALRAQALVRHDPRQAPAQVLRVGQLRLDLTQHAATLAGRRIELPYTEFRLLTHLARHRGVPQTWRSLLRAVWGAQTMVGGRDVVKSAVYRLRLRLGAFDDGGNYVLTMRGAGYVMPALPPVEDLAADGTCAGSST